MKISKSRLFRILFALLIVIYLVLNTFDDIRDGKVLLLIGIVISILLIYNSRKFKPLFLMMIFFFSYIFNLIDFYWNSTDISGGYQTFDIIEYYNYTLKIHVYFLIFLFASFPIIKDNIYFNNKFSNTQSRFLFILTISFMAFIFLFGSTGQNIFESGGYGSSDAESLGGTSIFEYFIVLIPLAYMFSYNNKVMRLVLWSLVLLYCGKSVLFGYRNQILQISLVLLCLIDNPKLKYRYILAVSAVPLYLLLLFGQIRQNPFVLFTENISIILMLPFQSLFDNFGNQNDVFYSTVRMYGLIQIGELSTYHRFLSFGSNILALVTPYSILPDVANLAAYKKNIYGAGGGGLISMYWFVFLGIYGPCLIGLFLGYILRKLVYTNNIYFIIYLLLVLSTYLRWFAYNQITMFKFCLYGVIYYLFLILIKKIIFLFKKPQLV